MVDFHQQLAVLQRTGRALHAGPLHDGYAPRALHHDAYHPAQLAMGRPVTGRHDVLRRRRDVFCTLAAAAGLTFLLALGLGGNVWIVHLLVDAALLGYVALLLQIKQARTSPARANVRYLPAQHHASATQQALLRRSAN